MNIKLPVLEKDHDWNQHRDKFEEECIEVSEAIQWLKCMEKEANKEKVEEAATELLSEVFDVMQMCVGVMDKLKKDHPKIIDQGVKRHVEKLYSRGWKFKSWLSIEED